jgi:hypothetical protein
VNTWPESGAFDQPLSITLRASPFSDPDTNDTHFASQWRVKRTHDSVVVFDSGEDTLNKTECQIPLGWLRYSVNYAWQVRYKDNRGLWSEYSRDATFGTLAPPLAAAIQGRMIVFTWPTNAADFLLVYTTNLSPTATWTPVLPLPVVVSGQNHVTNTLSGAGMFFRLKGK